MNNNAPLLTEENGSLNRVQIFAWLFAWLALVLDVMDWQMLAMSAPQITAEFGFSQTGMGLLLGAPLLGAGVGGIVAGWLADRFGRVKMMVYCLCWYSTFTIIFPMANSYEMMLILRILAGLGLGAQWGVGNTLVAELLPGRIRIMASAVIQTGFAFGPIIAAYASKMIIPAFGWRPLFYLGALGYILAIAVKVTLPEPPAWQEAKQRASRGEIKLGNLMLLAKPGIRGRVIGALLLVGCTLIAYWSSMSWIPSWLATDKGMSVVKSMNYMIVLNVGGVFGYILFAFIADRFGRKPPAYVALVASIAAVLVFVSIENPQTLLLFAPVYAFITYPVFGLYGGYLSELFPTEIRGTAVNSIYNVGRLTAFFGPYVMGWIAMSFSMTVAIGSTALLYFVSLVPLFFLPETIKKRSLAEEVPQSPTGKRHAY